MHRQLPGITSVVHNIHKAFLISTLKKGKQKQKNNKQKQQTQQTQQTQQKHNKNNNKSNSTKSTIQLPSTKWTHRENQRIRIQRNRRTNRTVHHCGVCINTQTISLNQLLLKVPGYPVTKKYTYILQ